MQLNGQEGFKDLRLEWTCCSDELSDKQCQKLRSLHIGGFSRGIQISTREEDALVFSSLVSLTVQGCSNSDLLPPLGQLPSLKKLVIWNVPELKILGSEFYGANSPPFRSLEQLDIGDLPELTEWIPYESGDNNIAFPCLQQLSLSRCPRLQGQLPSHLPLLEKLSIEDCKQLVVSVPVVTKHCTVRIHKCKEVLVESIRDCCILSSKVHLLDGIARRMFLAEGVADRFSKVGKLNIVQYHEPNYFLKKDNISSHEAEKMEQYDNLSFMVEGDKAVQQQELPGKYQYLELTDCQCPVN